MEQIWPSVRCSRCGAPLSEGDAECGHCHLEFDWVKISVPIKKDGSETELRGSVVTPEGWRNR